MTVYTGSFDKAVPGLDFIDRSNEGILDTGFGRSFDKSVPPLEDAGPYTLFIKKDGLDWKTVQIADHFWATHWWVELTPVTIVNDPAFLIAQGWVPPIGFNGIPTSGFGPPAVFGGPGQPTSGDTPYEPTTGGRGSIGIVNVWTAKFLITGQANDMIEMGKSVPSQPHWFADEQTGKSIVDLIQKPFTTTYGGPQQGTQFWMGPWPPADTNPANEPFTLDGAHMNDICGVLALATEAPRYVRGLQSRTVKAFTEDNYWSGYAGNALGKPQGVAVCAPSQTRKTAWTMRELVYCVIATRLLEAKGTLPADCLSYAQVKAILDNQLAWFTKEYMHGPDQTFRCWPDVRGAFWQSDFLSQALALAADNFPEWKPIYLWSLGNQIARTDGREWPAADPCVYYVSLFKDDPATHRPGDVYYDSWAQCRAAYEEGQRTNTDQYGNNGILTAAQVDAIRRDPMNGGKYLAPSEYNNWLLASLGYAVRLDRKWGGEISHMWPVLERVYAEQYAFSKAWGYLIPQASIAVDPVPISTVPPVVIPPVIINPPPVTGVSMPTTASLKVGQTVQLDLHNVVPPEGDLTSLTYRASPDGVVSLLKNATGVQVKGLKAGAVKIFGDANGALTDGTPATIETECDVTVTVAVPLVTSLGTLDRVG